MKHGNDFDALTRDWLEAEPSQMPDRALDATLAEIHRTAQVRSTPLPRGGWVGGTLLRLVAAAAVAVLAVGIAVLVFGRLPATHGPAQVPPDGLGFQSPSPSVQGTLAPQSLTPLGYRGAGTIAFTRANPALGGDAPWLINPSGTSETTIAPLEPFASNATVPGTGCCITFSPDGTKIAIGYDEIIPESGPASFSGDWLASAVVGFDGSVLGNIPSSCGGCGSTAGINYVPRAWSPDGRLIAIEVWTDVDLGRDGINMVPTCSVGCDTSAAGLPSTYLNMCQSDGCDWQTRVTGANHDVPVVFSPDSKRLLFVRIVHDDLGTLMALTIDDGTVEQLSPDGMLVYANDYFGPAASWSPDSARIAYAATDMSGSTSQMSAYVARADGSDPSQIVGPSAYLTTAKWSPDGSWIAFDRAADTGPTSFHDIYVVRPDGSGQTDLTSAFDPGICCARWSPDSSALLAAGTTTSDGESNLFIVPIDRSQIYQVTNVPAIYTDFSWGSASR